MSEPPSGVRPIEEDADHTRRRGARLPPVERLFDDIAAQMASRPVSDAAAAIAHHLRQFWDPRMRVALRDVLRQRPADPLAAAVLTELATRAEPERPHRHRRRG